MASKESPTPPASMRSFTRMDSRESVPQSRSNATPNATAAGIPSSNSTTFLANVNDAGEYGDVFEKPASMVSGGEDGNEDVESPLAGPENLPERFDELPIELISLTDRFVESLGAKVYDAPPSIDQLSDLFQDFYARAASHISTHVSTLASRLNRENPPSPSGGQSKPQPKRAFSSRSLQTQGKKGDVTPPVKEHQMMTATEVTERRKARKLLLYQQRVLEEAVERRACESVYDKIWRHRNTLDEVRDEKLRSRTAALSLVGIRMKDLGVDMPTSSDGQPIDAATLLAGARDSIMQMNAEKYPLGKLQNLTAAHKAIVDTLTDIFPSSSSADEILPTLIYTLITSPQDVNIISNLAFIQRFRSTSKIDGEAAYCLTNLEAAISFLEDVDMATLGAEELRQHAKPPAKRELTVLDPLSMSPTDTQSNMEAPAPAHPSDSVTPTVGNQNPPSRPSGNPSPQQRLSNLFQPPAKALGAANDIVRNTADQGIKNIGNTLDNSFNFLFGRLKEVQKKQGSGSDGKMDFVPKTLDDARRLVNPTELPEDDTNFGELDPTDRASNSPNELFLAKGPDKIGGDPTDSRLTGDTRDTAKARAEPITPMSSSMVSQSSNTAFDSMKSLGTTINPLNHIPGVIRGFGRNTPEQRSRGPSGSVSTPSEKPKPPTTLNNKESGEALKVNSSAALYAAPPLKKFVEMEDASQLRLGDIPELLQDYKRLASILNSARST